MKQLQLLILAFSPLLFAFQNAAGTVTTISPAKTVQATENTPAAATEIKWMSWDQMQTAQTVSKRKVFIDFYTDWCGWCKKLDATTFKNPHIVKYLNENFYAVKFDAETKATYTYNGKSYGFIQSGRSGYNELAAVLLKNQMSYPTSVYLDEKLSIIFPVAGYMDAKSLEPILHFVATNSYLSTQWAEFQKSFVGSVN